MCQAVCSRSWCRASWHLLTAYTWYRFIVCRVRTLGVAEGKMLKYQRRLRGSLVCTICYPCAMYSSKSKWSSRHQERLYNHFVHNFTFCFDMCGYKIWALKRASKLNICNNKVFYILSCLLCLITLNYTTFGRTSLDKGSARLRHTTHNIHKRQLFPQRDSNPQSQQANGRRPAP